MRFLVHASLAALLSAAPLAYPQSVLLNPTGSQTVTQPAATSLGVNILNNVYSIEQYCTTPGVYDESCLTNALTSIGSTPATLTVAEQISITSTAIIPTNIGLRMATGSGFNISGAAYLQISGPLDAPLTQVFYGTQNVYFYGGVASMAIVPQWFGAMGNGEATGFVCTAGSSTIMLSAYGRQAFLVGDQVTLVGAGPGGTNLSTTVTGVNGGTSFTVATAPSTTVSSTSPAYNVDNSAALLAWSNSVRGGTISGFGAYEPNSENGMSRLYLPRGIYNVCSEPFIIYSGVLLESEKSQISMGGQLQRCNVNIPAIKLSANNYNPAGAITNLGNGNSLFYSVAIRDAYVTNTPPPGVLSVPEIMTLPAANTQSDTRFRDTVFEAISGDGIRIGFVTGIVGTATAGSTTVTLADGSPFCNEVTSVNCSAIIIVGAGASGGNLTAHIVSGLPSTPMATPLGTQYTVTIDTPIVTTVTSAAVYAGLDSYGLFFERGEADVSEDRVINVVGNASGNIWVDNFEMFQGSGGCLVDTSLSPVSLYVSGATQFYGCGLVLGNADVTRASAIYWTDQSNSRTANLQIIGAPFFRYTPSATYGGNIHVSGLNNVLLDDIQCHDCERNQEANFLFAQNSNYITVSNSLISNTQAVTSWSSSTTQIQFDLTTGTQPFVTFSNLNFFNSTGQVLAQAISAGFTLNNPPLTSTGIHDNGPGYSGLYSSTVSQIAVAAVQGYNPSIGVGSSNTTWTSGSAAPSGGCQSGSLYTNTAGAASSTLYVCVSGAWNAVGIP